jgi:hypothetical protein
MRTAVVATMINKTEEKMKLYTSYFANAKALAKANVMMIGIALYPPRWYQGPSLKEVAPTYSILKMTSSDEEYTRRYKAEILARMNITDFINQVQRLANGRDVALCCYEKPEEFCHRQLLAEHLRANGIQIEEFVAKEPVHELSLFDT